MALSLRRALLIFILASLPALDAMAADSSSFEVKVSREAASEQQERDVDEVALSSQDKAISRIQEMLKKYRGTDQEPILLARLAELQQQSGSIVFRIAHGIASHRNKAVDLSRYNRVMRNSISTLNQLIAKYPKFDETPHAYSTRGKAYEEIKDTANATRDYLYLTDHYPESEDTTSAYMSLADFAITANDHPRAIGFLEKVEKRPEDPFYPFALYKLAWSHYNLKHIGTALSYAEKQIAYYDAKAKGTDSDDQVATSDAALKENTLLDATVFYLDGLEQDPAKYKLETAMDYFRKLDSGSRAGAKDPTLGKMLVRFAKLLRSHEHEKELIAWTNQVIAEEPQRQESLEVLLITYEHQMNNRKFDTLVASAGDMVRLYALSKKNGVTYEAFPRAQKFLLDTAEWLQALIIKNRKSEQVRALSVTLASIYDAFTKVVEESDPRIPRVHYNLAETLFAIRDYEGAARHYRWVVEHGDWGDTQGAQLAAGAPAVKGAKKPATKTDDGAYATVIDASLKAIAARYEVLQEKKLIPLTLTAIPESKNSGRELDPMLSEWVGWIDTHLKHSQDGVDNFRFEGDRALYAAGHITDALQRLQSFATTYPSSNYAIPSASLVIDTRIAGEEWDKTYDLANSMMDVREWKHGDFGKRLFSVAGDAYFKLMEARYAKNDYRGTLDMADDFLKRYPGSARTPDVLSLAGSAAMIDAQKDRAMAYYSQLISESPKAAGTGSALLARASVEEDHYEFAKAGADYRTYLLLGPGQIKNDDKHLAFIRKKAVMLAWLSGDETLLSSVLSNPATCPEALAAECQKYKILAAIAAAPASGLDEIAANDAYDKARDAPDGDLKTLYAALSLQGAVHLEWHHRLWAARYAGAGWDDLDPLVKFTLVPYLSTSIPLVFSLDRKEMADFAPLRANDKFITHRVDAIREIETAGAKVMKLPWARIRAEVLNELAGLYLDLSRGLSSLTPPKNLSTEDLAAYDATIKKLIMPFEEKGQDMREKAFEIASSAAIEDDSFQRISEPFFAENPSQAKALRPIAQPEPPATLDLAFLARTDPSGTWKPGMKPGRDADPGLRLKALWMDAIKAHRWPQISYFMQEAQEKALILAGPMSLVKAISLATAGARGEGLAELEDGRKDLNPISRNLVLTTLIQYSLRACARDRTQTLLKEVQPEDLSQDQAGVVATATGYARGPASAAAATTEAGAVRK